MAKKKMKIIKEKGKKGSLKPVKDQGNAPSMASSRADVLYTTLTKKKGGK